MSSRTRGFWSRVWELMAPWKVLLLVTGLCVVASSLVELVPPLVVRHVIDENLLPHQTAGRVAAGLVYLASLTVDAALGFAYAYLAAVVAQRVIAALRVRIFERLTRVPVSHFDRTPLGDFISRATADVETVDDLFTSGVATLIGQVVPVVAVAVAMIALSPLLSAVALVVAPPLLLASNWLRIKVRDAERATRVAVGRLNTQLSETLGGVETVRVFGREAAFAQRFRGALTETLTAQAGSVLYNAYFAPVTNLLYAVAVAALLWVGGAGVFSAAGVSVGTLTAFVLLFQRFFTPIVAIGDQWQSVQAALAGAERVFDVLDLPIEPAPPRAASGEPPGGGIEVRDVTHGYADEIPVLRHVGFRVGAGEHAALVGRTGAGKSTLVSLLGGLATPWEGQVRVGGRDPAAIPEDLRRHAIAVVPQNLHLFSGTVRDNVTFGDQTIPEDDISNALALAQLNPLLESLPEGDQTLMAGSGGGSGARLSAGERQLIALARALAGRPRVIILDEATAAIDAAGEAAIRDALQASSRVGGISVFTVAHRLATARQADRVFVMEQGRIVEEGSPAELLRAGGRFAALVELEEAGWDWSQGPV